MPYCIVWFCYAIFALLKLYPLALSIMWYLAFLGFAHDTGPFFSVGIQFVDFTLASLVFVAALILRGIICFPKKIAVRNASGPSGRVSAMPDDAPNMGFSVLGFFFPLVGLILFLVWKDQYPLKAKSCGKGALVGVIVPIVLLIFIIILGVVLTAVM